MRSIVSSTFAFAPLTGTLANAKANMEALENCRDVFVAEDASPGEPVKG